MCERLVFFFVHFRFVVAVHIVRATVLTALGREFSFNKTACMGTAAGPTRIYVMFDESHALISIVHDEYAYENYCRLVVYSDLGPV